MPSAPVCLSSFAMYRALGMIASTVWLAGGFVLEVDTYVVRRVDACVALLRARNNSWRLPIEDTPDDCACRIGIGVCD